MNFTKNLKRTRIKKECIKHKFNWIIKGSNMVLFFHYIGSKRSNWEIVKKNIFTNKDNFNCKGLVVPSNLSSLLENFASKEGGKLLGETSKLSLISVNRFLGSQLLIGCESMEEMCSIVEICKAPTFYCVGGLYGQENVLTHLDIKHLISLEKSLQSQNDPQMTKRGKMCANLLYSLGVYTRNCLMVLQNSLYFHPAPVHLVLHNVLTLIPLKKELKS